MQNPTQTSTLNLIQINHKPYFNKNSLMEVPASRKWNVEPEKKETARLDRFESVRIEMTGNEAKVIETWRVCLKAESVGREFNTSVDVEILVPPRLITDREKFLETAPQRFAETCEEAQKLADQTGKNFVVWEYETGMFQRREAMFLMPNSVSILATFYPTRTEKKK